MHNAKWPRMVNHEEDRTMKFIIPEEWSKRKALEELEALEKEQLFFSVRSPTRICPACRNYDLERQWCQRCNHTGYIEVKQHEQN